MYNDSEQCSKSHVPLSETGGGDQAFSISSIPPTDSASQNFSQKAMLTIAEDPPEYLFNVKGVTVPAVAPAYDPLGNDGSYEELCMLTAARERGYVTWVPIGHSQKADVSIWLPPYRPITIQVKRARFAHDGWRALVAARRGGKDIARAKDAGRSLDKYNRYKVGDFDVLAAYVPPARAFRFYALKDVAEQRQVTVSDLSTLNNWHVIEDAIKHNL
jgi:hypothetical protein